MVSTLHDIPGRHIFSVPVPAHLAATATETLMVFRAPFKCVLKVATFVPASAITGQDTNTTNLNLINRLATNAGTDEVDNVDFVAGTDAAVAGVDLSGAGTTALAAGAYLALQYEKVGTGLLIPPGVLVLQVEGA